MEPSPSYERYCRQRKATLDKERYLGRSRSLNDVVEEIFEVISTEDEVKRESSIITSESSCATWSLSSSAIMPSNPSLSTPYDGEEDLDVQKQIQSYTSQLFSPLYEVRADQKNVFQENRKPLPRPGQTPKFRNLCYNLGAQFSFDHADDQVTKPEFFITKHQTSPKNLSPTNQGTCSFHEEHVLSNVHPLVAMTTAEVKVRNISTTKINISSNISPVHDGQRDWQELVYNHSVPPKITQMDQSLLSYDEIYARKDWMLNTSSTADSGELSLEPLLNAYSEDLDAVEKWNGDEKKTNHQPISLDVTERNIGPVGLLPISKDLNVSPDFDSQNVSFKEKDILKKEVEKSSKDEARIRMCLPLTFRIPESIVTTNFLFLRHLTLDLPFSPLNYTMNTWARPFDSAISKDDMGCSSLVRYHRSTEGTLSESSWVLEEYSHSLNNSGCFLFDIESLCTLFNDWENPPRSKYTSSCGGFDRQSKDESNESLDSKHDAEKLYEIDTFIRDHGLDTVIEFDEESNDRSDLFTSMSQSSFPTSFDSEQFFKDMTQRIESELPYLDADDCNDDTTISTVFPEISMNLLSSYSYSSDDGLDREIGALGLFELNLKEEIDKADKTSLLLPLTSPIQTLLSSKSSNCSIFTTFLSEYDASGSHSSENLLLRSAKGVRKVHFNEQVEEFLYAANEACWTPDAKSSGKTHKTDSLVDEIYNVLDDILDEINSACVSLSAAMDRTKQLSKHGEVRRSSVN
jgi:hypothetical protein